MGDRSLLLDEELYAYLVDVSVREPEVLRELRLASASQEGHAKQIAPEQAQLLGLLVRLTGARRILEVGTFRGYSALALALALPAGGRVVTCDVDAEQAAWGRTFWERGGVADRIEFRAGPALDTLDALLAAPGGEAGFDAAFIDADKRAHDAYYERALRLVRAGGLVVLDNVLWQGRVTDPSWTDDDTQAIRSLNRKLHADRRVDIATVPLGDGFTIARKRG